MLGAWDRSRIYQILFPPLRGYSLGSQTFARRMDGWTNGWVDRKMARWPDGCMDGWMDKWMDGWISQCVDEWWIN